MSGERRKKFNAIFFAAIMVISMVAMGVGGLAGSAAALEEPNESIEVDDLTIGESAEHEINVSVSEGDDIATEGLAGIQLDYDDGDAEVDNGDLTGVDPTGVTVLVNGDPVTDLGDVEDIEVSHDSQTLDIEFRDSTPESTSVDVGDNDEVSVTLNPVVNPTSVDDYDVGWTALEEDNAGWETGADTATLTYTTESATISGTVDFSGEPVDGATVTEDDTENEATTDADGEYDLEIDALDTSITAFKGGFVNATDDSTYSDGGTDVDLTLTDPDVSVEDPTGAPTGLSGTGFAGEALEVSIDQASNGFYFGDAEVVVTHTYSDRQVTLTEAEPTDDIYAAKVDDDREVQLDIDDRESVNTDTYTEPDLYNLSADPATVADGETVQVDVDVFQYFNPETETGDLLEENFEYSFDKGSTIGSDSFDNIATGSTDSTFSGLISFNADEQDYVASMRVDGEPDVGSSEDYDGAVVIDVSYNVDVTVEPADPVLGDSVEVSGTVTDGDGEPVEGATVTLEDEGTNQRASFSTTSEGTFLLSHTVQDASDEWTVLVDDDDIEQFEATTFTVAPEEGTLDFEAEGENSAFAEEDYTLNLTDADGDGLNIGDDDDVQNGDAVADGYVNVTGPFDEFLGDGTTPIDNDHNVTNKATATAEGEVAWIHVEIDDEGTAGTAEFSAVPIGDDVTAELEVDENGETYEGVEIESYGDFYSYESPDIVADGVTLETVALEELNVNVDPDESSVEDAPGETFEVSVTGDDAEDAGTGDARLQNATVTVSGLGVDAEHDTDVDSTTIEFDSLAPETGGELEVDVVAFTDPDQYDDEEEPRELTLDEPLTIDVDGDQFNNVVPESANVDDTVDVGLELTDTDGEPINVDRNVIFEAVDDQGSPVNAFNATDVDGVGPNSHLVISSENNRIYINDDGTLSGEVGTFSTTTGEYLAENITFEAAGDVNVDIEDTSELRATGDEVFAIGGVEAYEVDSDLDEALAGANDQHNITVTEDGAEVNGTDLGDLTVTYSQADDEGNVFVDGETLVDRSGDGTDDTIQVTLRPENATESLDIDIEDGNDRTGATSLDVVEPEITTSLGDDALTEGVRSPDENQSSDSQYARFTSGTGTTTEPGTPACVYYYTPIHTGVAL